MEFIGHLKLVAGRVMSVEVFVIVEPPVAIRQFFKLKLKVAQRKFAFAEKDGFARLATNRLSLTVSAKCC